MQNHLTLTGAWKIMNMAKLGTVSAISGFIQLSNYYAYPMGYESPPYTLCEIIK